MSCIYFCSCLASALALVEKVSMNFSSKLLSFSFHLSSVVINFFMLAVHVCNLFFKIFNFKLYIGYLTDPV